MQKLIVICGSPCVGKSTAADLLFQMYQNSAYLDGDWCWCVNPFSVEDPRLREGDKAMSAVLSNYLRLGFDYVVFCSVVAMYENIREGILGDIPAGDYQVIGVTLTCSDDTLRERHRARGDDNDCSLEWLHLPCYPGDYVIYTDGKSPQEVAEEMKAVIDGAETDIELRTDSLILRPVGPDDVEEVRRMWDFEHGPVSPDEAHRAISRMAADRARNRQGRIHHLCLAVTEKSAPERIIGWCGLDGTSGEELHIFYSITPELRGRGYATQAARAMLDYAFRQAGVSYVNGGCYKDNLASYRVMEKAGLRRAGSGDNGDPLFYISREDYSEHI